MAAGRPGSGFAYEISGTASRTPRAVKLNSAKNGDASATLSGGSFAICKSHKKGHSDGHVASIAKAKAKSSNGKSKKKVRSLWANAHGNFTTKGAGGSAAVLGTKWYTEDRCDGTYFKVARDKIKVTVYYPHRHTVIVKQGHSFLAPPKP